MSLNSFGHMYKVTTWGESHGPSLGATIDGCPPGIEIDQNKLQVWMDKENRVKTNIQPKEMKQIVLKYYLVFLKGFRQGHLSN